MTVPLPSGEDRPRISAFVLVGGPKDGHVIRGGELRSLIDPEGHPALSLMIEDMESLEPRKRRYVLSPLWRDWLPVVRFLFDETWIPERQSLEP